MVDVTVLYTHKKTGVLAALLLLTLTLFASMPAAWADPGFTLEDVTTWYWADDTLIRARAAVADVDGDPSVEIVTGGYYHDGTRYVAQLCVWDARRRLQGFKTWYWTGFTEILSVAVGDVDGDGSTEIVTGGYYHDGTRYCAQLCVWDGATLSLENVKTWHWTSHTRIESVAIADVDGDGDMEIVTGGYYYDGTRYVAQLAIWDGSTLTLEGIRTWYWVSDTIISSVAVGDVDGDGSVEIVTGGYYWNGWNRVAQLVVWSGSSLALENVKTWYWTHDTWLTSVAVGDVDGDGQNDIVTGGYYDDGTRDVAQLAVWNGATLALERVTTWYWTSVTYIKSVACADVDGDGDVEIVTGGYCHDGTRYVAQLAIWDGTLSLEDVTTWFWVDDTKIYSVAVGDAHGDGQNHIVTGGYYDDGTRDNAQLCVWGFT